MDEAAKNPSLVFSWRYSTIVQACITASARLRCMTPNIESISAGFPEHE